MQEKALLPQVKSLLVSSSVIAIVIFIGLTLSLIAFQLTRSLDEDRIRHQQERVTELVVEALTRQHERNELILEAITGLFEASEEVSRQEFSAFVANMLARFPYIYALEWAPQVLDAERTQFEQRVQQIELEQFEITQLDQQELVLAERRPFYFPVLYAEPYGLNRKALGFDLASQKDRALTIRHAIETRSIQVTPAIQLVQQEYKDRAPGVLLIKPYFRSQKVANGTQELKGLVLGVFHISQTFNEAVKELESELDGLSISMSDVSNLDTPESLYTRVVNTGSAAMLPWPVGRKVKISDRQWLLVTEPSQSYVNSKRSALPGWVFFTCLLLTLLLGVYVNTLVRREQAIRKLVAERSKALKESERRLRVILANAADAIIAIDGKGKIGLFNPAAQRLFGYSAEEVLGENVRLLMPEPYHSEHDAYLQRYQATGEAHIIGRRREVPVKHKDGRVFPVQLSIGEAGEGSEHIYVGVLVDLTLRKAHERALVQAKEAAEAANQQKSSFLNVMSHELRTPLTVMLGYLPLLEQDAFVKDTEAVKKVAQDMSFSGNHLLELINDLLDISKIEAGQLNLVPEQTNIQQLTEGVLQKLSVKAQAKQILMHNEVEEIHFVLDPMRLRQILINLIGNAVKFTDSGQIFVRGRLQDGRLHMEVEDTGCGIDPEQQAEVFEAFRQADNSRTRSQGGTGLGLAITRRLVEAHQGTIVLESEPGKGTRIYFTMEALKEV